MIGPVAPYNSIGEEERRRLGQFATEMTLGGSFHAPLSGYLAGKERGGYYVCLLEAAWCETFRVKHAIACNSATSALLAASFAIDLHAGDEFIVSPMTMSATAAAPMFTGARPVFCDVNRRTFGLDPKRVYWANGIKAVFLTHLFGLSIDEGWFTGWAHQHGMKVVVDAAQSPLATCDDVYAGTTADIGVYSLNVHKHFHCGEGGVAVTNDDELAARMRAFINHGEHSNGRLGLNLRLSELCASVALTQLRKAPGLVQGRIEQAEAIIEAIGRIPGLRAPYVHPDCRHVYYTIPFVIDKDRSQFCNVLREAGVPIVEGYIEPLYRMAAFDTDIAEPCLVAEDLHDYGLFYFENCAWSPTKEQITAIGDAFQWAAEAVLEQ